MLNYGQRIKMRKSQHFQKLAPLLTKVSFTTKEAKKYGVSSALLSYYLKTKQLKRLYRGVYQNSAFKHSPANFPWEELITAIYSIPNGVICLVSALALYNLTDEIPRQHWIAIAHNTSAKKSKEIKILRFRNMSLGKTKINLNGIEISIFDRERTIIDAFRLLSLEIAIKALKIAISLHKDQKIDLKKLQNYAKKLKTNIIPYLLTATT